MTQDTRDVIVIGAGPAGLAAAQSVADHGLSVRLIDEQAVAGGQIWRNAAVVTRRGGALSKSYIGAAAALRGVQQARIDHATSATVLDVALSKAPKTAPETGPVSVTWLSAVHGNRGIRETTARALIIATGALERPVLFPGATLPGVMGVGAVQSILKQSGLVPSGDGVVLAGQGPLLLVTLAQILDHGGRVSAVLDLGQNSLIDAATGLIPALLSDPAIMAKGAALLWRARRSGVVWHRNVTGLRAMGSEGIEQVAFETGGKTVHLPCALLAVHDGVIPNTQLTRLLALDHDWSAAQQAFAARVTSEGRTSAPSVWVAGDGAGIAGAEVAGMRGTLAGLDVARALGALEAKGARSRVYPLKKRIARRAPARALIDRLFAPLPVTAFAQGEAADNTLLCRCEAVTLARIQEAIADGATGPNRVKTFTRCGMGACQGRICGNPLTRIVAEVTRSTPQDAGALRIRPPLKPTLISDYLEPAPKDEPMS
jgi:NADPH-dependent 2,4-dienoyl-CoA reductase/sulfur reductase-like enzyme